MSCQISWYFDVIPSANRDKAEHTASGNRRTGMTQKENFGEYPLAIERVNRIRPECAPARAAIHCRQWLQASRNYVFEYASNLFLSIWNCPATINRTLV